MFSFAAIFDDALAASPNDDGEEPSPANAPKPDAGFTTPEEAAANGDDEVWLANAPNPVPGFTKLELPELGDVI